VFPDARITPACPGLWNDEQEHAWKRIVTTFTHTRMRRLRCSLGTPAAKARRGECGRALISRLIPATGQFFHASPIPYIEGVSQTPREATRADMDRIKADFVSAARRGETAGFDWLEFHCAHGYLISSFISPLTNQRTDEYGGSLENRCRYPWKFSKRCAGVPQNKPMSVRISAHDWVPGGLTPEDAAQVARLFKEAGADVIDCSAGQVSKAERPVYGRMFQCRFRTAFETRSASRPSPSATFSKATT